MRLLFDLRLTAPVCMRRGCVQVEVAKYAAYVQRKAYLFHRVFSETTQQRQLYRESVLPVVHKVGVVCACVCV